MKKTKFIGYGNLPTSPVRFIDEDGRHEYRLQFDELHGVTGMLDDVFGSKYPDTPAVRAAADRGTCTHILIQAYERGVILEDEDDKLKELSEYMDVSRENCFAWTRERKSLPTLRPIGIEYLVSNEVDLASKVDIVFQDTEDKTITLADIKTSKKLDVERVTWQLSVYAYLFSRQTGYKVNDKLLVIHTTEGKCELVWLDRKTDKEVEQLIDDWRNGRTREIMKQTTDVPAELVTLGGVYAELERAVKEATAKRDEFRDKMLAAMQEAGVVQVKADGFTCSVVGASERRSYNTKRLLEENPDLQPTFDEYLQVTQVKECIRITLK